MHAKLNIRAESRALSGGGGGEVNRIFIYSRSATRISFEISCHLKKNESGRTRI